LVCRSGARADAAIGHSHRNRRASRGDPRDQQAAFVAVAERCKPLRLAHTTRRLKSFSDVR
jgi:hypothetical protein